MMHKTLVGLTVGGLLMVAVGCGKGEDAAPPARGTDKGAKTDAAAPQRATEQPVQPPATAGADVAIPKLNDAPAAKMADPMPAEPTAVPLVSPTQPAPATGATDAGARRVDAGAATAGGLGSLSQDQMVQGLREALAKGLQQAVAGLGRDGGFLGNPSVKIPMPEKMQKVESVLRTMKQEKLADDFVATMNHAAEQAVPEAASVFAGALKQMTIADGKSILSGSEDAATRYFQKTTQADLYAKFLPIVQKATEKAGVTGAYKKVMVKVNVGDLGQKLGGLGGALGNSGSGQDSVDLDAYVTNKALEGLFKTVAAEEKQIRQNPVARTTDLLQKVFGAVTK